MNLEPYDFRDPGAVLVDVAATHHLVPGELLLALVHRPSTVQELVTVRRLRPSAWQHLDPDELSDLFREEAEALPLVSNARGVPEHSLLTILVRRGLAVIDAEDARVFRGWRYANHFMPVFDGGLMVVTEHGWCDFISRLGGHEPRLEPPHSSAVTGPA